MFAGLGDLFESLPACWQKEALKEKMSDQIIELYNNCKWTEGDAILQFLPNDYAKQLLDWYFHDDDASTSFPPKAAAGEDENSQPREVQSEPQGTIGTDGEHPVEANASDVTRIGEPADLKPLIRRGEGEPDREAGLAAGSPMRLVRS